MAKSTLENILAQLGGAITVSDKTVSVTDEGSLRAGGIEKLIRLAVFGSDEEKAVARWLIWETALALNIYPASIHEFYMARGAGQTRTDFTVPAMNLRAMPFYKAVAAFKAAHRLNASALLFEIARSEMGYTDQRPSEYAINILAAAIQTGHNGPVFVQGDHFQVSHGRYHEDAAAEVQRVKDLAQEAISAGFYNIDIDTSTLVDLSQPTLETQQQLNAQLCADISAFIRGIEPKGVTISLGGEIGEVGEKNSTVEELHAFMTLYGQELAKLGNHAGISKISVQTGTSHGGVVLPDGSIADVAVDFETLAKLSHAARTEYHIAGAVQHGASTLPESAFNKFAEASACEIHLATGFQNIMYDHPAFPAALREEIYAWVTANYPQGKNTVEQLIYKERKRALGQFKADLWNMDSAAREAIMQTLEEKFSTLFGLLNIHDTHSAVLAHTTPVKIHKTLADFGVAEIEQEDVSDLAD
jgi:fructose/tagatose bisphosphate aldolase